MFRSPGGEGGGGAVAGDVGELGWTIQILCVEYRLSNYAIPGGWHFFEFHRLSLILKYNHHICPVKVWASEC